MSITPLPTSMAVFVGGPKNGWKVVDPKAPIFYIPKPPPMNLMEGPITDKAPVLVRGVYERRHNEDTGVPGYVWMGWEDDVTHEVAQQPERIEP